MRIKNIKEFKTEEDLITMMVFDEYSYHSHPIDPILIRGLQARANLLQKTIKDYLPMFTEKEILKITEYWENIKRIYDFSEVEEILTVIEFRHRTKRRKSNETK